MKKHLLALVCCLCCICGNLHAQIASNPDKFLGNITTSNQVNGGGLEFATLWNQITPENESKWQSIEGRSRGQFNWSGCDAAYKYAKEHNFPFKFHTLVWGSQYPNWMNNLSTSEQYKAIVEWMDAVKERYPDLQLIDVVNEAISGHAPAPYKNALGGDGTTGYDWIVKAFEMAHERWPDAILIYNDYNTFQWQRTEFIDLVKTLINAGAPIDAYGCQSHDLNDMSGSAFKAAMKEIQDALQIPMYITEYDISKENDNEQLQRYKEQFPTMWEADYCAGVTLWGYIYGKTWSQAQYSGLIKNGKDRAAMTWLKEYMQTNAAKTAKSPFEKGSIKEASVYVRPSSYNTFVGQPFTIQVDARLKTKTIDHVDIYADNQLIATVKEAPYTADYTPTAKGNLSLKAVVVATDGTEFKRPGGVIVNNARSPFKDMIELPGTLEVEDFDVCAEGVTYHDSDNKDEGDAKYRSDAGGVDLVKGNGGIALGYTATGEWLEYTVNVTQAGEYSYEAYVSSGSNNSGFSLALNKDGQLLPITNKITVPNGGNWDDYTVVKGKLLQPLEAGQQIIRLTIESPYANIDKIVFNLDASAGIANISMNSDDIQSVSYYTIDGRRLNAPQKGLNIIKMVGADGSLKTKTMVFK